MNQSSFVIDFAHSAKGQVKRIRLTYKSLAITGGVLVALSLILFGFFSSYLQMSWEARKYEHLQADFERLRSQYSELKRQASQHQVQMASLETLASEVSAAYGINRPAGVDDSVAMDADSMPNLKDSIQQYNFLQSASYSSIYRHYAFRWQSHNEPSIWPVDGILRSSFGGRSDPFSGDGAFHTGVDLQVPIGTPVSVSADGVVESAGWSGRYGKLLVVNHGNGIQTYYAHLSGFLVLPGQEVRRGEQVALSGGTGHVTGPHLHYEVRVAGTPVNPYRYMAKSSPSKHLAASHDHDDLGL